MNAWSITVLAVLGSQVGILGLLAARHVRYVRAHRDQVPAAFAGEITLAEHRKAADYTTGKTWYRFAETTLDALLIIGFTLGGGLTLLGQAWTASGWTEFWAGVGLLLSLVLSWHLLTLPLQVLRTFGLEQRFGFNRTTARLFALDQVRGLALGLVLGTPLIALLLVVMHAPPLGLPWWLWVWTVWLVFMLFMSWAGPSLIAPLFNRFYPLKDDALRARLERLVEQNGFVSKGVQVMDGSARSTHGNAYFAGFGASRRIVLFDTLVAEMNADELCSVLAHELGHYRLKHIRKRLVTLGLLMFGAAALLGWLAGQEWFYHGLGVEPSPPMALALFGIVGPVFLSFLQPAFSAISRRHEFEADAYALRQAPAAGLRGALIKLFRNNANTLTPDPWHSAWHDSHPPAVARLARIPQG